VKTLECGCEQHQDTGTFMSLCFDHGQHMLMRKGADAHPRNMDRTAHEKATERELAMLLAPVVLSKWSVVTDPQTTAECIFQHVKEIMRRLE
jgi:hypothetical protein